MTERDGVVEDDVPPVLDQERVAEGRDSPRPHGRADERHGRRA